MPVNSSPNALSSKQKRALLAQLLKKKLSTQKVEQKTERSTYALSQAQQALWLLAQQYPDSAAYNVTFSARIHTPLNLQILQYVLQTLLQRHAVLRTRFSVKDSTLIQRILPDAECSVEIIHLSALVDSSEFKRQVLTAYQRSFDLENDLLFRATVFEDPAQQTVLSFVFHHIICDAWSVWLFVDEFLQLYRAKMQGEPLELVILQHNYADFVIAQQNLLHNTKGKRLKDYWLQKLSGELTVLQLPADYPPSVQMQAESHAFVLSEALSEQLKHRASKEGVTLYSLLVAAFQVLLYRYSGQDDILLGSPVAGRDQSEFATVMGYFVNQIVLRSNLQANPSFRPFLAQVRQTVLEALKHQDYPFPELVKALKPARKVGRSPLFQVYFVLQQPQKNDAVKMLLKQEDDEISHTSENSSLCLSAFEIPQMEGQFDLSLEMLNRETALTGIFKYNGQHYSAKNIEQFCQHWQQLLSVIVSQPDIGINDINLVSKQERKILLQDWNATEQYYPLESCLHELIEQQVKKTPDACALVFNHERLSYKQLNERANQLAWHLRHLGTKTDSLIGVSCERSVEMVVALLAVLKAGAAYLPLDPDYPETRLRFMLEDAQLSILLSQKTVYQQLECFSAIQHVICLDDDAEISALAEYPHHNLDTAVNLDDLAYVIYTSGSTGKPKGAMNTHRAICNRLHWMQSAYPLDDHDAVLQKTPFSFDVSVWEFFWPLLTGARLVVAKPKGHHDSAYLSKLIQQEQITTLHFVPSMLQVFLQTASLASYCQSLQRVICSGEALSLALQQHFFSSLDHVQLHNLYGPTEAAIDVSSWHCRVDEALRSVPIGYPIANIQLYVLNEQLDLVPIGMTGELYIGGVGLARGYLNREQLTTEMFIANPFYEETCLFDASVSERLYKTGDRVRYLSNGSIEYLGRIDYQVKLRGLRIELGEIEVALTRQTKVREAIVLVQGEGIDQQLVAYYVAEQALSELVLKQALAQELPEYMVPAYFVSLEAIPLNANGKVDRHALLKLSQQPTETGLTLPSSSLSALPQKSLQNSLQKRLVRIWQEVLQLDQVGVQDNFFDLGGYSLLLTEVQRKLQLECEQTISLIDLFQYTTIDALVNYLSPEVLTEILPTSNSTRTKETSQQAEAEGKANDEVNAEVNDDAIAIIGLACRFPGANDVESFWHNLANGVESVRFFTDEELLAAGIDAEQLKQPNYVKANACLDHIDQFDADFFAYSPKEAALLDPQQRLFLEVAWQGIEQAGYDVERLQAKTGVFAGVGLNQYLLHNIASNPELLASMGGYHIMLSNDKDFLASRVAYKLNLQGPAITVQTACSTSLVAVHLACQSLLQNESDMALAGGTSVLPQQTQGYLYQQGMILSPDGHCRPFDQNAEGTIGGSGVGVVLLKRLEDALTDGDTIHAVIKASQINNDGAAKAGYTAPSIEGQKRVITDAMSDIDYDSITYVEAHGTGTTLGDPIEMTALSQAYQQHTDKKQYCAIGSVKSNIGHLDTAAGVAALIKTSLALSHQKIPPSLNFQQANDKIDFADTPFYVNTTLLDWQKTAYPRRAAVSSFGIGGTNAHVILEEFTATETDLTTPKTPHIADVTEHSVQLLLLSARTENALTQACHRLAVHLDKQPQQNLSQVAYTLAVGRKIFPYQHVLLCDDRADAIEQLQHVTSSAVQPIKPNRDHASIIFMFPGQGSQTINMAKALYQQEMVFRHYADDCFQQLKIRHNLDIKAIIYPQDEQEDEQNNSAQAERLRQTQYTQPALFVIEYALAQCFLAWGIRPTAMIGHSLGEYVAACLSGVFSLSDALDIVVQRAKWISQQAEGSMLSVSLSVSVLNDIILKLGLNNRLCLAAINGQALCSVSGHSDAIAMLKKHCQNKNIECVSLHTSHAFHSEMMQAVVEPLRTFLANISLKTPQIPYISNLTGDWIQASQATDPEYWVQHLRQPVQFSKGIETLSALDHPVFIEMGPGRSLTGLLKQHIAEQDGQKQTQKITSLQSLPHAKETRTADYHVLNTLGRLHFMGFSIAWQHYFHASAQQRVTLPTYPFERKRYWIEPVKQLTTKLPVKAEDPVIDPQQKRPINDWFYRPSWRRVVAMSVVSTPQNYLLFIDKSPLSQALVDRLVSQGHQVVCVRIGDIFCQDSADEYRINPQCLNDYQQLFKHLKDDWVVDQLVYAWSLVVSKDNHLLRQQWQTRCFDSLLFLVQAWEQQTSKQIRYLSLLTHHMHSVSAETKVIAEQSLLLGAFKVIQQEYSHWQCRAIDVALHQDDDGNNLNINVVLQSLSTELQATFPKKPSESVIAWRDQQRWLQYFMPITLAPIPNNQPVAVFRQGGVYLICGGLGGIGLVIAHYLAKNFQAKLLLLGRSSFPDKRQWASLLELNNTSAAVKEKIKQLMTLEEQGADVSVLSADVAEMESLRTAVESVVNLDRIHGVIHAAGVACGGIVQQKSLAEPPAIFTTKVNGTRVLTELFATISLDFMLFCSSISAIRGDMGQVDYAAANAFMDASAHVLNRQGKSVYSINWDTWQQVGMAARSQLPSHLQQQHEQSLKQAILPNEGTEILLRIMQQEIPQVIVSTRCLQKNIAFIDQQNLVHPVSNHDENEIAGDVVDDVTDDVEKTVLHIWQTLLGVTTVAIDDDFFDLGGHSLLATQVISRIRDCFEINLSLDRFFAISVFEKMVAYIEEQQFEQQLEQQLEQSDNALLAQLLDDVERESVVEQIDQVDQINGNKTLLTKADVVLNAQIKPNRGVVE